MHRDVFQAIADPTRREILSLIASKKMTPNLDFRKISIKQAGNIKAH